MAHGIEAVIHSTGLKTVGESVAQPLRYHDNSVTGSLALFDSMAEAGVRNLVHADDFWHIALRCCFNPVGSHVSGLIGENPGGIPNNLMPNVSHVAVGPLTELQIFGGDYPTLDGTGVLDYIHVVDLAEGPIAALDWPQQHKGVHTINLGAGHGTSVLEAVCAFETVCRKPVPYRIVDRRLVDIAHCYDDASCAEHALGWKAKRSITEMSRDA